MVLLLLQHQEQLLQACWDLVFAIYGRNQTSSHPAWINIHHPRDSLSSGLLDYQIPASCEQVPFSPISSHKDVAVTIRQHGIPGAVHFPGLRLVVPSTVAAEVLLVSSCGVSVDVCACDSGMHGVYWLVAPGEEVVFQGSSPSTSSLSPSVH